MWAVWGHFQGSSLCLTSSVCWSLQCLISVLTWGGGHFFFLCSLVQSFCGEGGMLQTNSTVVCTQCLSPAGPVPAHCAQTAPALRCSAWNHLRLVLGCVHLPGRSRSGLALRQPSEAQIRLGLRFVPFPGPSSSGVWRARSLRLVAFSVSAAQFLGGQLAPLVRQMVTVQHPQKS